MTRTIRTLATIGAVLTLSAAAHAERDQCDAWMAEHYQQHELMNVIREYEQDGAYHFRANYRVVTSLGETTAIGFECTVYDSGKVVGIPELTPYAKEQTVTSTDLPRHRMSFGADACPDLAQWKSLIDEHKAGNYTAPLADACIWIEQGDQVLGPVDEKEYNGFPLVQIQLPNGTRYWIEPSNI